MGKTHQDETSRALRQVFTAADNELRFVRRLLTMAKNAGVPFGPLVNSSEAIACRIGIPAERAETMTREQVETELAAWLDRQQAERPANRADGEPLIESQQAVYETIRDNGPIQGKEICRLARVERANLKNKIIPALKKKRGVKNLRGAGYYLP